MGNTGECLRLIAVSSDNAAAVSENADDAAVFPVSSFLRIRQFHQAQNIIANIYRNLNSQFLLHFWLLFQLPA